MACVRHFVQLVNYVFQSKTIKDYLSHLLFSVCVCVCEENKETKVSKSILITSIYIILVFLMLVVVYSSSTSHNSILFYLFIEI